MERNSMEQSQENSSDEAPRESDDCAGSVASGSTASSETPLPPADTTGMNANVVAPDIIISNRNVAENEEKLRRLGVTHIVTLDTHPLNHDRCIIHNNVKWAPMELRGLKSSS